jgi:hypothetical protein
VITPYYPTPAEGAVETIGACYRDPDLVLPHITAAIDEGATIMVLASCGYMLVPLLAALRRANIPYWNPYRRDQSAWNPLGRRGPGTTLDAIAAYLAYWRDGQLSWTHDQLAAWLEITTGVVRRGMKQALPQLLDLGEAPVAPYLLERIFTPEALSWWSDPFSGALDLDAGCKWLAERLIKSRQSIGRYALGLAAAHGADALDAPPNTIVGTIHSVKGGEADRVLLFPDLSTSAWQQWHDARGREEIRRVFYVGATRARDRLLLAEPTTTMAVPWR